MKTGTLGAGIRPTVRSAGAVGAEAALVAAQRGLRLDVDQNLGRGEPGDDRVTDRVGERVRLLEAGARLKLQVEVDVAGATRTPGPQLVVARDLGGAGRCDRLLDQVHLALRQRLVDEDAG